MTVQKIDINEFFDNTDKYPFVWVKDIYFECDNGWISILENLFNQITKLNIPDNFKIVQIKEKFGTLRIYAHNSTIEINKLIREAEITSFTTCEVCGELATLDRTKSWWKTLCEKHKLER